MARENTDTYQAIIAAFSLISYADGVAHKSELSRLVETLTLEPEYKKITAEKILDDTADTIRILDKNFEKGKKEALAKIEKIKGDMRAREFVLKIARLTLIADDKILEPEEALLADIHTALGVPAEI